MKESKSLHQKIDQLIYTQRVVLIILSAFMTVLYLKVQYSGALFQNLNLNSNFVQYLLVFLTVILAWQSRKLQQKSIFQNKNKEASEKLIAYTGNLKKRYRIFLVWGILLALVYMFIGYKLILAVLLLLIVFTGKEKPSVENLAKMYQIQPDEIKKLKHSHYES